MMFAAEGHGAKGKAEGTDQPESARELLRTTKTADELKTAQAVLLPLELGLSLEHTAKAIGRSVGATCNRHTRYCKVARYEREAPRPKRTLRNRANATLEREAQILHAVLEGAMRGGVTVVPPLKEKIGERLGKTVVLSKTHRMLARNGWHKSHDVRLPDNLRLLLLPPYSSELNPQEHLWQELRKKHFHNRVFDHIDALADHLVAALRNLDNSPHRVKSFAGWGWIINAGSIAK